MRNRIKLIGKIYEVEGIQKIFRRENKKREGEVIFNRVLREEKIGRKREIRKEI